ncbi:DUF368 domain-containing protein [Salirhabdus salicampi]|uniref:DUF368 domain-containing protein n=1 Tax=Salirhabdus salicampi TaxID=476102 RepID=UPI0020C3DA45|nr:DUF368 domain-containing protein [Salirhabdus salicampi]MCP8618107.1 DUF368 domain-containing protein [Salirhabdus salicampi]
MGTSDLVPGVSGGTIAVVLGIYDRLIEAINGFFSREWKKHLGFLLPLGVGVITAVLLLSNLIDTLWEHYPNQTQFFFLGLIIGIIPYLIHKADYRNTFRSVHYILFLFATLLVASMAFLNENGVAQVMDITSSKVIFILFLSGILASMAMILPGISGSFILLLIGVYPTIIHVLSERHLFLISVVGVGVLTGIVACSKIVRFFLEHYYTSTYAVIIGLVVGSIFVIFPGFERNILPAVYSIITFGLGMVAATLLGKFEYK